MIRRGDKSASANGRTDPNLGITFDDALGLFDEDGQVIDGPLATDRPHQAKAQLVYTAPFGVNVGVFQMLASGLPVTRFVPLVDALAPVFYAGRGSDGRTQALSQTDVSVQYVRPLGGRTRLTVGLNVLNVFNQAAGISRFSRETDAQAAVDIDHADYYAGRADVTAAMAAQQTPRDPRFLQYEFFQDPIKARLSVRFSF